MTAFYVNVAVGSDSNGGTHPTTDAWQTFGKIASYMSSPGFSAGDVIYVLNTGDYPVSSGIFFSVNQKVHIVGTNSSGVVDGTKPRIYASASLSRMIDNTNHNHTFSFLDFDGNGNISTAVFRNSSSWAVALSYCRFRNGTTYGLENAGSTGCQVTGCEMTGNSIGVYSQQGVILNSSWVHDNSSHGVAAMTENATIINSWIVDNGGNGCDAIRRGVTIATSVIARNAGHGIAHNFGEGVAFIVGNIIAENTLYGVNAFGNNYSLILNNWFYNNGSGAAQSGGGSLDLLSTVGTDPLFRDKANDDYDLTSASTAVDAYLSWRDRMLGGVTKEAAAGGGEHSYAHIG